MNKYFCLCAREFKNKKGADAHLKENEDLELIEGFARHKIFKNPWWLRFLDWFLIFSHTLAYLAIFWVISIHFDINWSAFEASIISISIGVLGSSVGKNGN